MMDSLFTIAIMQFHLILAWISDAFMCCETRSNIATGLSDAERYSIRKWCGTRPKNLLEINHAMRTTDFATEHFPLPPLQQVQVSIRTCRNFKQKMKFPRLELTKINLLFNSITHAMCTTYQAQTNQFAKAVSSPSLQPFARDFLMPARLCKLIQRFLGCFIFSIHVDVLHFLALLIGRHTFLFVLYDVIHFQACYVLYDVVIFKLSFPLKHYACYVVADSHVCHEPSTGWQVIRPQPCKGQNKYFVCCLFLIFGCPFLHCMI
jgi:hypothetical protein